MKPPEMLPPSLLFMTRKIKGCDIFSPWKDFIQVYKPETIKPTRNNIILTPEVAVYVYD